MAYTPSSNYVDTPTELSQHAFTGFDDAITKPKTKHQKHVIADTLAKLNQLHMELNSLLYSNPSDRPIIRTPKDAYEIVRCFLDNLDHEQLWVLTVDSRHRLIQLVILYKGTANSSQVRIAEIFRAAICENSPAVIVCHNHPSGDPSPSPEDIAITRSVVQVGKLLDIEVLDHIVVGKDNYVSLKPRGLGFT